jgi:WD40 repeat protein
MKYVPFSKMASVQVWSLDSPECKFTLSGHSHNVRCLDFFTRDGRKCLVTGSLDKTAKVCYFIEKYINPTHT